MLNNKRILIIRLSSIGDVLHATPVAKALKKTYPACHITWIVSKTAASLIKTNPYIDEVLIWSREEFEAAATNRHLSQLKKLWLQLKVFYRHKKFDIALDIHGLFLTGAIIYASRTPRRIGMAKTRELNRFFMTEQAPAPASSEHVIKRYLSVLQPLGIDADDCQMTLNIPAETEKFADTFFLQNNLTADRPIVMVNPKTSWSSKNWDNAHFAKCIELIDEKAQIIICGGSQDRQAADWIKHLIRRPIINAAGQTSLLELAALLKKTTLLLTGDTGTLHIGIAVETPTISLWGPTRPQQYGPMTPQHKVMLTPYSCRNCHKTICRLKNNACMAAITPESVAVQINAMLFSHR